MKYNCLRITRLDRFDRGIRGGLGREYRAGAHRIDGPGNVARSERAAIVEVNTAAQMKDEPQRIRLLPALGQRRGEMEASIAGYEAIKEQFINVLRLRIGSHARVEAGGAALDKKDDC